MYVQCNVLNMEVYNIKFISMSRIISYYPYHIQNKCIEFFETFLTACYI